MMTLIGADSDCAGTTDTAEVVSGQLKSRVSRRLTPELPRWGWMHHDWKYLSGHCETTTYYCVLPSTTSSYRTVP